MFLMPLYLVGIIWILLLINFRGGNVHLQVKGVMVSNIEKVTQRGDKLDDLGERAGSYFCLVPLGS